KNLYPAFGERLCQAGAESTRAYNTDSFHRCLLILRRACQNACLLRIILSARQRINLEQGV
ncbi:MAG: hypothetical protein Q7J98_05585, partial [Kiritimatiellia bacterium]|nr:hypothetical protein [Kiritimatiellia bacterium]